MFSVIAFYKDVLPHMKTLLSFRTTAMPSMSGWNILPAKETLSGASSRCHRSYSRKAELFTAISTSHGAYQSSCTQVIPSGSGTTDRHEALYLKLQYPMSPVAEVLPRTMEQELTAMRTNMHSCSSRMTRQFVNAMR